MTIGQVIRLENDGNFSETPCAFTHIRTQQE